VHNYGSALFGQVFIRSLGTRSRFSATSVDQLPQMLAALLMFGHQLLLPVPDVDRTQLFLAFGANPLASNGSLMTAPGIERRLKELRARGGRLIVVDPRRTETAALADLHVPIRPGSDALLLLALLQVVLGEGLARPGRLDAFTDGRAEVEALVRPFTPEAVAPATGVPASVTRELAREFARTPAAVAYGRVGVSMQEFGGLASWLINVLNAVTGNLDRVGGAMFTRPAVDLVDLAARVGQRGHFDKGRSRVRGLPEFGGEYPAAVLAEEIETEGAGQIRALVTCAGNPVLSTPNGARLERALAGLDFMVSVDIYLNETTRHAHLILPPTDALEHDLYDVVFHVLAVRNTAKYSPALFEPPPDARHDWQIFLELARRIDAAKGRGGWKRRLNQAALRRLGPSGLVALAMRLGPHGLKRGWNGVSLARLRRSVHGVDLGALEPCLPDRLFTRGKRVALAPERFVRDVERLRPTLSAGPNGLLLIGRRDLRSNNSWMHNSERLTKGRDRCTLLMHPDDAARRSLSSGQSVRISSRVGEVVAPVEVTPDMMPGVVCLPHGWGHHREGTRLGVAGSRPGASFNDLADDQAVDALCGTARFSGTPVEVAAVAGS
jgi:anaerobic selenocysteine-containing dehydrogenase